MKLKMTENQNTFSIELIAEGLQEAALLTRFGMNGTSKLVYRATHVSECGTFSNCLVIGKRRRADPVVPQHK